VLLDPGSLQALTLWTAVVAATLGLVSVLLGVFSALTGKDHWPKAMWRLRRRMPASEEDRRMQGIALMLNGAAMLIILMGVSMTALSAEGRVGEPLNTLRFVLTLIGLGASIACVIGAYGLLRRVRYTYGEASVPLGPRI
jgi:hypothetical protein